MKDVKKFDFYKAQKFYLNIISQKKKKKIKLKK